MNRIFKTLRAEAAGTALTALFLAAGLHAETRTISLRGDWHAALASGSGSAVRLPGTLDMAGIGEPDTLRPELRKPQLLHLTRKVSYVGPCTYTRSVDIPADMAGKPLRLKMERVLWKSSLKVDGKAVGDYCRSLSTPHCFDIPPLKAGEHILELTVDNSRLLDISDNNLCHSYTNDTQTMWNGVLGDFTLSTVPAVTIEGVKVFPDIDNNLAEVVLGVINSGKPKRSVPVNIIIREKADGKIAGCYQGKIKAPAGTSEFKAAVKIDNPKLWSEFTPSLYTLEAVIGESTATTTFGMREVTADGRDLKVNGRKTFLRGTLDCCVFPLTGVPATDREGWVKEMQTLRDWGFNHIRFHSWCPPEAAFEVADSLGIYLQTELPVWSLGIGDDTEVPRFMGEEFVKMSAEYGNHPSWIMTTCGNELQHDFGPLNDLVTMMRAHDPRHLYAATSYTFEPGHGGHAEPHDQFIVTQYTDDGWVRGQGVFDKEPPAFDKNYSASMGCVTVPLVSHEIGQYAVYPDIAEIDKYTGVLDPLNFKAIREDLRAKGLLDRAPEFLRASGKFAFLLYKEEIERALKTPGITGVQLLGIQDFPGQGTATIGLLDAFWDEKGVASGADFSRFNAPVVPLADFAKAVYSADEPFTASLRIANYGDIALDGHAVTWTLSGPDGTIADGVFGGVSIPLGEIAVAGTINTPLDKVSTPSRLTLTAAIDGTPYINSWNIWVYPPSPTVQTGGVTIAETLEDARKALADGQKVLLITRESIEPAKGRFLPVFWSPVHFPKQAAGMGVTAQSYHPALRGFPNDGHSDWQWWLPLKNAAVMNLDSLTDSVSGTRIEPIVSLVDNFVNNRRLGYLFEASVVGGRLMVSSIDLTIGSPEIRSFLQGILDYMNSDSFNPHGRVSAETLERIVESSRTAK